MWLLLETCMKISKKLMTDQSNNPTKVQLCKPPSLFGFLIGVWVNTYLQEFEQSQDK